MKRFFEGRICFTAAEGFSELFINACRGQGARLFDIFVSGDRVLAAVKYSEYKRVLKAADMSGMTLEITKKTGLPALFNKYKTRIGLPVGILLAAVIIQVFSGVLWSVEVSGLQNIKEDDFSLFLDSCGVKKGVFLVNIDCNEIELMAENLSPLIMRVTANLIGSKLYIEVFERVLPPEMTDLKTYGNVIAGKDGEVISADILAGVEYVKAGDAVIKGELLAGGIQELSDGSTRLLRAQAIIMARTKNTFSCQTALNVSVKRPERMKDSKSLYFFGLVFPPQKGSASSATYLSTPSSIFPIGILRTRQTEFSEESVKLSETRAKLICITDLACTAFGTLGDTFVADRTLVSSVDSKYSVEAEFYCEEDIAQEQLFEVAE
ncbi:MAG: sporulation protein YqfD [Oscillospiraceae bacterium]|nr:sporulation protein YqfD [Oscillospiraceae bacterium]